MEKDNPTLGILCAIGAAAVFSVVNLLAKTLMATYPVTEVVFFRVLFALIPTYWLLRRRGPGHLYTPRPWSHALRAIAGLASLCSAFLAFHLMPLAESSALVQSAPLFVTMLSVPLLGERVGLHRKAAVAIGFLGVLLIVQPGPGIQGGGFHLWGSAAALFSAFTYALAIIYMRQLTRRESAAAVAFWYTLFSTGIMAATLPFGWVTPGAVDLLLLVLIGLMGGISQFLMSRSYALAPAVVIAPLTYTGVAFAALFGYTIWGDLPNALAWSGIGVVAVSTVYIAWREHVRAREAAALANEAGADPPAR
ncbi:MAG: DMT family transporter [Alphaproteobacteria bacterium]|nr:DMT family transporter [Alphaproteobacteria bacterium]